MYNAPFHFFIVFRAGTGAALTENFRLQDFSLLQKFQSSSGFFSLLMSGQIFFSYRFKNDVIHLTYTGIPRVATYPHRHQGRTKENGMDSRSCA